jgi:hypothetical protein
MARLQPLILAQGNSEEKLQCPSGKYSVDRLVQRQIVLHADNSQLKLLNGSIDLLRQPADVACQYSLQIPG